MILDTTFFVDVNFREEGIKMILPIIKTDFDKGIMKNIKNIEIVKFLYKW